MNTLYLLGGPPRTAKTTIMSGLAKQEGIAFIAADAVQHGMRNMLVGEPHQLLRGIEISGSAEWKTSITEGGVRKPFRTSGTESDITLQAMLGMFDYYRRNNESVAFEGTPITPDWVRLSEFAGSTVRAAFTGYTNPNHVDQILEYANSHPDDWINEWVKSDGNDEAVREWVRQESEKSAALKSAAERLGYSFFDISAMPFAEYIASAQQYFLKD